MRTFKENIDYTNKDYESFRNSMIENLKKKMPEYTDTRQSDAGIVLIELLAQGLDVLSFYQDVIANEVFLPTQEQRDNALKWCSMLGYIPKFSVPSRFKQVFVLSAIQNTDTIIPKGSIVKTVGDNEEEIYFETVEDLLIPKGKLGDEKDSSQTNYLYTVDVVEGIRINNELLGSSNGTSSMSFKLSYAPVIVDDSLEVLIDEGSGFEKWKRVDNFIDSKLDDKHFICTVNDNNECTITFGNGVFGKIPFERENNIYCNYRVGGGERGNVGANKIIELESNIAIVDRTFNPEIPFIVGREKESLEEIKRNAPIEHRNLWGALTLQDFSDVVKLNFPLVQFAISERSSSDVDNINIYVYLQDNRELTQEIKNEILDFFNENKGGRKIVGAGVINILPPTFEQLNLTCNVIYDDRFKRAPIKEKIKNYIENYFKKGNYDFNTELSLSELAYKIIDLKIEGLRSFKFTVPTQDILKPNVNQIYTLNSLNFVESGGIE